MRQDAATSVCELPLLWQSISGDCLVYFHTKTTATTTPQKVYNVFSAWLLFEHGLDHRKITK